MDKRCQKILQDLKSSSYRDVHHALVELRTLLQTHRPTTMAQKLRKLGITRLLVRFLKKKYERLIYITLSILGTCCLELETRELLQHEQLPQLLVKIQSELTQDQDQTQSRICRCIGNLAALPAAASDFHDAGVVPVLVDIIKSETSNGSSETKQMSVRALRELGDTGEHRQYLLENDAVKVISDQLSSGDSEIVKASLKTLVSFCSSIEGAVQVQRGSSGSGFEQLVSLAQSGPKPDLALLCICNLAHVAPCRPDLGKAGAITVIFDELKKSSYKSEPRTLITALCLFCSEIVNRTRMRDNNQLADLLDLFRCERYSYLHDILLIGLNKYLYDDISLQVMVEHGLISALMHKLRQHIRSIYSTHHDKSANDSNDVTRRLSFDCELEADKSPTWQLNLSPPHGSPHHSPASYANPCNSPSTSSFGGVSSPSRSPQTLCWSPAYSTCSSLTETYSPVYDDSSDDDNCDELIEFDFELSKLDIHKEEEDRHSYKIYIFILLAKMANHQWALQELMASSTVNTLLAYLVVGRLYTSKVGVILTRIMSRTEFLLPMVNQRYALLVYTKLSLRRHETNCNTCSVHEKIGKCLLDKAASVAEGPFGEGELSYLLQRGKEQEIIATALAIPFVVRTCWLLKKLLVTHNGLPMILSLVTKEEESSNAILALSSLAKSLHITYSTSENNEELFLRSEIQEIDQSDTVTFLLDDGSQVQASKTSLGDASHVFKSMLHGSFRESKEDVVKLKDISKETLKLLLMYCKSYVSNNEVSDEMPDVVFVLELFIIADKFLITDLNHKLINYTKRNYLNSKYFVDLYKWCSDKKDSMVTEISNLFNDASACLLVGSMKHKTRIQLFNSLIKAGMWEKVKSCISYALIQRMEQGDFE